METTNSSGLLIGNIAVGSDDRLDRPRDLTVTSDGSRVYVPLETSGRVALVDPIARQQIDTKADIAGINPIDLPSGAAPRSIVLDSRDQYAYIADGKAGGNSIYVLDINPSSSKYHQVTQTITVGAAPSGLRQMAISSDGKKLFVTAPNGLNSRIYVVNIDPKDRPRDPSQNPKKWNQLIGTVTADEGVEGLASTVDPLKMTFTNSGKDSKGFGVLDITNNDPLSFAATTRYTNLELGSDFDYFDVNEGVSVTVLPDASYAFVVGRNSDMKFFGQEIPSVDGDPRAGSNIGIIKDPLTNPQLVAATRPIPDGFATDLVLSGDSKYLYASYPNLSGGANGKVYVFDTEEFVKTVTNPGQFQIDAKGRGVGLPLFDSTTARTATVADLSRVPIDNINPAVSIAADFQILADANNQYIYGVPPGSKRAPVAATNSRGLAATPLDWLDLTGPGENTNDLTPTFEWEFAPGMEDVREVNLFISKFPEGEGLLPWDQVRDLSDPSLLPDLSEQKKRELLTKPWNGYDDFNPNRILTATWKKDTNAWYLHDGTTPIEQPVNDPENTSSRLTLADTLTLTAGQKYDWSVEAISSTGARNLKFGDFNTSLSDAGDGSSFRSVTVMTHGFTLLPEETGIPDNFYTMGDSIAEAGDGLMMRYDKPTGYWVPVDLFGRQRTDLTNQLNPGQPGYLEALASNVSTQYLSQNKSLVLLNEWSLNRESIIPDAGFTEAAADAIFASMVQLDQALGGDAGFDEQGNFVRLQGALFNSPLHFIGFSRGTVVTSEIVQRFGTYFPNAGGISPENRDFQMTTIDPHDFAQPSLRVSIPLIAEANFADFYEPKIPIWDNVTFSDNYYQTVANPNGFTSTPNGRNIPFLPTEELVKTPRSAGLNFPQENGIPLGHPDVEVLLGTREGQPGRDLSRLGFTRDNLLGATHARVYDWYAGTVDLDLISEQLDDIGGFFDPTFSNPRPWYSLQGREGTGEGWFYSVLGGGKDRRPESPFDRVPVTFDNTYDARMRGDAAVPTLFNGNFDHLIPGRTNDRLVNRNTISKEIPGWSFHNSATSTLVSPTNSLVDWSTISTLNQARTIRSSPTINATYLEQLGIDSSAQNQTNYALKLEDGQSIVHNRFVVPEWGTLRFNLHVPTLNNSGTVKVSIKGDARDYQTFQQLGTVQLTPALELQAGEEHSNNLSKVGFGTQGFETFQVNVPNELRGKVATLKFEVNDGTVYLDDVFFKSEHLKFGNPTEARYLSLPPSNNPFSKNLLIEKPQYALSYNEETKNPNWVSWQLNQSWLGTVRRHTNFLIDTTLPTGWSRIKTENYTNSGYDRGHMIPSGDRTRNKKDNVATFLMTNVLPQAADNNRYFTPYPTPQTGLRPAWYNFEKFTQNLAYNGQEVYVIAGGYGSTVTAQAQSNVIPMPDPETDPAILTTQEIQIPGWTWKVALALDRPGQSIEELTANTPVYAIITPNTPEPTLDEFQNNLVAHPLNALFPDVLPRDNITSQTEWRQWETWQISVKQLEELLNSFSEGLNFKFLSAARRKIEQALDDSQTPVINVPNFDPDPDDVNE